MNPKLSDYELDATIAGLAEIDSRLEPVSGRVSPECPDYQGTAWWHIHEAHKAMLEVRALRGGA